jgi:hypothetical protein
MLFGRKTKKTKKAKRKAAKPATGHKAAAPAPRGATRKPRQTARPKPATAPA